MISVFDLELPEQPVAVRQEIVSRDANMDANMHEEDEEWYED